MLDLVLCCGDSDSTGLVFASTSTEDFGFARVSNSSALRFRAVSVFFLAASFSFACSAIISWKLFEWLNMSASGWPSGLGGWVCHAAFLKKDLFLAGGAAVRPASPSAMSSCEHVAWLWVDVSSAKQTGVGVGSRGHAFSRSTQASAAHESGMGGPCTVFAFNDYLPYPTYNLHCTAPDHIEPTPSIADYYPKTLLVSYLAVHPSTLSPWLIT